MGFRDRTWSHRYQMHWMEHRVVPEFEPRVDEQHEEHIT